MSGWSKELHPRFRGDKTSGRQSTHFREEPPRGTTVATVDDDLWDEWRAYLGLPDHDAGRAYEEDLTARCLRAATGSPGATLDDLECCYVVEESDNDEADEEQLYEQWAQHAAIRRAA